MVLFSEISKFARALPPPELWDWLTIIVRTELLDYRINSHNVSIHYEALILGEFHKIAHLRDRYSVSSLLKY